MPLLVEPEVLSTLLNDTCVRILDTRFNLSDRTLGQRLYNEGHIPGAIYADLEQDLSGPVVSGESGRHPLPDAQAFAKKLQSWGIDEHTQVIIYDDGGHAMAARAWWLLRWMGLTKVSLLHTGLKGWQACNFAMSAEKTAVEATAFESTGGCMPAISAEAIMASIHAPSSLALIDARAIERFNGGVEPIDSRAGHIPGAVCHPFACNMDQQGRFLSPSALSDIFEPLLKGTANPVFYCGSGVTACHNVFAMEYAGLGTGVLYPGSWSEWIVDENRPVVSE